MALGVRMSCGMLWDVRTLCALVFMERGVVACGSIVWLD
jgi:hypothetical protein|nr:MAG TPA: hypothetical protein [Caudoviricetes sp.]